MKFASRLQMDWPFPVARLPFFYGWVIAAVSTLGFLCSVPGQTMGMAVFSDTFIAEFGLTRTELSTAYLFGTVASAFTLPRAGRWYDRWGARFMLVVAPAVLGIMLLFISGIDLLADLLVGVFAVPLAWVTFPLILVGYFGVRFSGQGVLTSASRNVLLVWFEKRRGLVSGIRGVFVSLGFSIAPLILAWLIDLVGWRAALWWMALAVGVGFTALALFTVRDHPRVAGLAADGQPRHELDPGEDRVPELERTAAQAKRDPVFWVYSAALSMHALFGTAVTFHIVAIFAEAGRDRVEAFAYFLPQAVVSLSVNLIASALADYNRLKPMLVVMLVMFLVGAYGITQLQSQLGYWLLVIGFGAGGGLWGVLSNLAFIRQFGVLHLGEISGLNTAVTVFASAIGPVAFSLANDTFGTFNAAAVGCAVGLVALLLVAILLPQPFDRSPHGLGN